MTGNADNATPKRGKTQVTLTGNESSKRRRTNNDNTNTTNYKPQCLEYLYKLYIKIAKEQFRLDVLEEKDDIFLSVAIFNQVAAVHNAARQTLNGTGEMAKKYIANNDVLKIYGKDYNLIRKDMVKYPEAIAKEIGLEFEKKAEWLGTAQTMITLTELFGERLSELRIGVDELIVAKDKDSTKVTKVSLFGISTELRHICYGMNFKQSTKNSMAQSIGVGTVMVVLSHGKSDNYSEKWVNALSRDMAYIPEIKSIAKRLSENKSESNTTIISLLSQIAAVVGSRHQHRIVFPPIVLIHLLTGDDDKFNKKAAESIDFAGKGAFLAYKKLMDSTAAYKIPSGKMYREIVYHCMFGTYLSDLSVLEKITDYVGWSNRGDIHEGKVYDRIKFSCKDEDRNLEVFHFIGQKYYSKMSSSSMTSAFNSSNEQAFSEQVFAGYVKRKPTEALKRIFKSKETVGSLQNPTAATKNVMDAHLAIPHK